MKAHFSARKIKLLSQILGMACAVFSGSFAHAACNSKDPSELRLDCGGAMENVPVRNQLYIGDCYAQVTAQMFDAWRFTHGDHDYERLSSGFEINQRFQMYRNDKDINNGGLVEKAIPLLVNEGPDQGSCDEALLEAQLVSGTVDLYASDVMGIFNAQLDEYYRLVQQNADLMATHPNLSHSPALSAKKTKTNILAMGIEKLTAYNQTHLRFPFHDQRLDQVKPVNDTVALFAALGIISCGGKNESPRIIAQEPFKVSNHSFREFQFLVGYDRKKMRVQEFDNQVEPKILNTIHRELDRGLGHAMPIGISYCSTILKQGLDFEYQGQDEDVCERHASIVMGRRVYQGNAELLVRNSWGPICNRVGIHDNLPVYNSDWECDGGNIWIDENKLAAAIFEIQTVVHPEDEVQK
jgi:hypothetical protein